MAKSRPHGVAKPKAPRLTGCIDVQLCVDSGWAGMNDFDLITRLLGFFNWVSTPDLARPFFTLEHPTHCYYAGAEWPTLGTVCWQAPDEFGRY
ncbi:unnamed protein product [Protopolystoma xenopodis]|uniref:Uncharacterized protein n=1 Tax=Protopolystoma xenopodis TaxID=117903 RepID=A0A448WDJ9_9PLAT|nr:unnamed protein product [Protopolystoma xenopodis]